MSHRAGRDPGGHGALVCPELAICAAARQVIGWDRVAVVAADGVDHRLPLPGSDEVLQHYGDLQQSLSQGPGVDAVTTGAAVLVDDLQAPVERWTVLMASVPASFPVRSLAVVPLLSSRRPHLGGSGQPRLASDAETAGTGPAPGNADQRTGMVSGMASGMVSGVLIAARDAVARFTAAQVGLLQALAALVVVVAEHRLATGDFVTPDPSATSSIGSADTAAGAGLGSSGLWSTTGDEVAMVVGMLRARLGADEPEAVAWLRAYAFTAGTTIHEVARAVLAGGLSVDDLTVLP